jgi:hypothetical protein
MLYKNAFGPNFDLGFNLNDYPNLTDKSWHNDVSPSFYFNVGSQYYVLWVDYLEPEDREQNNSRYTIITATNEGDEKHSEIYSGNGNIVFESEKTEKLFEFMIF